MNRLAELDIERLNLGSKILDYQVIQELWSGYGVLARVKTDRRQFVIKQISYPQNVNHPKGHVSSFAHERKVKSYQVEMEFYSNYTKHRNNAYTPEYITHKTGDTNFLIIEDLQTRGFHSKYEINFKEVEQCIKWLANLHYTYLNHKPEQLWEIGCYWHLDTRPKEYKIMQDGPLKEYAQLVDQKLKTATHQTILHGDAKLANFLFNSDNVSAVDFQYTGGGAGVKDLAYFLSSVYGEDQLFEVEEEVLDLYFTELERLGASDDLLSSWRALYPYAWFDFYRFLAGWSPEHYKINKYIKTQMHKVLDAIK